MAGGDIWRRLDDEGATILQDDFTERFEGIFKWWSEEVLLPHGIGGSGSWKQYEQH